MYLPAAFREDRTEVKHGLIQAHPLGLLVATGAQGVTADALPFMLYPGEGEFGVLRAHLARANPLARVLAAGAECLVVFQGPEEYISPSWYETKRIHQKVVPTWNYAMVQVRGNARMMDDAQWLRRHLDDMTAAHEGKLPEPWLVDDAPAGFVAAVTQLIIGFELPIAQMTGKWKTGQNRSEGDQRGVMAGLLQQQPPAQEMVALMAARLQAETGCVTGADAPPAASLKPPQ